MPPTRIAPIALRGFVPLDALSESSLVRLAAKSCTEILRPGEPVFHKGDVDRRHVYLLRGKLQLCGDPTDDDVVAAGTPASRQPIAHRQPRPDTVRALTDAEIFRIDSQELDVLLTWDQSRGYEVDEIAAEGGNDPDWMIHLLQTPLFQRIPPTNIHALFRCLEAVPCKAGDRVVRQGDEGEYFYIVREGECDISRHTELRPQGVHVAKLGPGETFGEEALIAATPRTASVTMRTDGKLMRLSKEDFTTLLRQPVMQEIDYPEAHRRVLEDTAVWLDVRMPPEHEACRIANSLNVPLIALRLHRSALEQDREYIVYCDTGRRSAVAVYVLAERGYRAALLSGGLAAAPPDTLMRS